MSTTNKLQLFGHRREIKISKHPMRFAQRAFPRARARSGSVSIRPDAGRSEEAGVTLQSEFGNQ
jgi:hypothetical protein